MPVAGRVVLIACVSSHVVLVLALVLVLVLVQAEALLTAASVVNALTTCGPNPLVLECGPPATALPRRAAAVGLRLPRRSPLRVLICAR